MHDEQVGHRIMWGSSNSFMSFPLDFTRRHLRSMPSVLLELRKPITASMCHAVAGNKGVVMDW